MVELEPAVRRWRGGARAVNRNALANPRLTLFFGDAREHLLTTRERYDLIVSEPSNPYRAGIASLFSRDSTARPRRGSAEGGLFLQWVQAYEIHPGSLRSLYATFAAELPAVETWQTLHGRPHARGLARAPAARPRAAAARGSARSRSDRRCKRRVAHRPPRGSLRPLRRGAGFRRAAALLGRPAQHRRPQRPRVRLRAQPRGERPRRRGGRAAGRGRGGRRPPRVRGRDARSRSPAGRAAHRLLERGGGAALP